MDGTIAKTLTEKEKVVRELTLSSRFINIMMALSIIKWVCIFAILSFFFYIAGNLEQYNLPIDIPFLASEEAPLDSDADLEKDIEGSTFTDNIFGQAWTYPIIVLLLVILPIVFLYYQFYLRIANRYALTSSRIIFKRGWLSTQAESIHYDRITDVLVTQSIWDRFIFGSGKIFINTAGGEDYEARLLNVADPYGLKREIYSLKEAYLSKHSSSELGPLGKQGT